MILAKFPRPFESQLLHQYFSISTVRVSRKGDFFFHKFSATEMPKCQIVSISLDIELKIMSINCNFALLSKSAHFSIVDRFTTQHVQCACWCISGKYCSMTQLLTHSVTRSTKPSSRPKTNNQSIKKFLSLAVS